MTLYISNEDVTVNMADCQALKAVHGSERGEIVVMSWALRFRQSNSYRTLNAFNRTRPIVIDGITIAEELAYSDLGLIRTDMGFCFQQSICIHSLTSIDISRGLHGASRYV
jgi:hypothetical protein